MRLGAAPASVVRPDGTPALGQWLGLAHDFPWERLAPPYARGAWWRRLHHKRWHYAALATPELFCGVAIVDVGWTNTAFAYAFDRVERRVVAAFSRAGVPGLTAALAARAQDSSRFRFGASRIALGPDGVTLACAGLAIDACFVGTPPVLLAVGPAQGGAVHATQKSGAFGLEGWVRAAGRDYPLTGGCASYDYSNGLLGRNTAWRWASAHAHRLGFNLQAGYFGARENPLWLDGRIYPLAAAHFEFAAGDPLAPWHVHTEDGLLDLHFTPEGARREDKDLLVAASRYVQPIGVFNGWVRPRADAAPVRVANLAGVTEDHASRW